jgi:SAM-dependent methyltransferase
MKIKTTAIITILAALALCTASTGCTSRQPQPAGKGAGEDLPYLNKSFDLDVRWGASPKTVMLRLFQMTELRASDVFYDLGCGDGRVVVEAVKMFGLRGKGVDIDPARIIQSRERAAKAGVADKTTFLNESFFDTDFTDATVVFAFLNNTLNKTLRPRFLRLLKPGSRIIMHTHDMGDWQPDLSEVVKCECVHNGRFECYRTARLYVVPANVTGTWKWKEAGTAEMKLNQKFQKISGEVNYGTGGITPGSLKLNGEHISFTVNRTSGGAATVLTYTGTAKGNIITGTIVEKRDLSEVYREWKAVRVPSTWKAIDL